MKKFKLFSSALAVGMLLGTAVPSMQSLTHGQPQTARAAEKKQNQRQLGEVVELEDGDVWVNNEGTINTFSNPEKAAKLLDNGQLEIPETLDGQTITGIQSSAFSKNTLRSVAGQTQVPIDEFDGIAELGFETPENITNIGYNAFGDNNIDSINLPNVVTIGSNAFVNNAITSIDLPNIETIDSYAFADNAINSIELPNVTTIETGAFSNNQLTTVDLENITTINPNTFANNQIQSVNLPNVDFIGSSAFNNNKLTQLELSEVTEIEPMAFQGNAITAIDLPNITDIGWQAFMDNQITNVSLPNVTYMGNSAFKNNQIKSIELPKLTSINFEAFRNNRLTKVTLPEVTQIYNNAFANNQITELDLPEVTYIDYSAFQKNGLASLELDKVEYISNAAFAQNKLSSIKLPKNVEIYPAAFSDQTIKKSVTADENGEVSVKSLRPQLLIGDENVLNNITNVTWWDDEHDGVTLSPTKIAGLFGTDPIELNLGIDLKTSSDVTGNYSADHLRLTVTPFDNSDNNENGGSGEDGSGENESGGNGSGGNNSGNESNGNQDNNSNGNENNNGGGGTTTQPDTTTPTTASRPHTVYATRAMRLHKNVSLTSPVKSYKKQSRAKAASFRVLGVAYDKNGKKRYKVNGGYITASTKYVADAHFRSSKVKQVRVIGNSVNSYKNVALSKNQKVRNYKKGTKIKVSKIVKYGRTTRFQLSNGRYITGNKQLLIMDQK